MISGTIMRMVKRAKAGPAIVAVGAAERSHRLISGPRFTAPAPVPTGEGRVGGRSAVTTTPRSRRLRPSRRRALVGVPPSVQFVSDLGRRLSTPEALYDLVHVGREAVGLDVLPAAGHALDLCLRRNFLDGLAYRVEVVERLLGGVAVRLDQRGDRLLLVGGEVVHEFLGQRPMLGRGRDLPVEGGDDRLRCWRFAVEGGY